MTISVRASTGWTVVTADAAVTLPTHQAGDRIYVFATWKAFDTTCQITAPAGWTEVTEFADGSVAAAANVGSVKVGAWYFDCTSASETNPTLDWSVAPAPAAHCAITLQKASNENWDTPLSATAAIAAATNWTATASSTMTVKAGAIVMELAGFRDDSATMTRDSNTSLDDDGSPTVTWNGNVVEDPATHASSTSSNDISADLIHRFVTTGAAGVNLTATGTLAASETGACLWVHQGVTAAPVDAPPPRSRVREAVVVAAWAASPILLWSNGVTIPETSANVPNKRGWVEVVNRQWAPATWSAQSARHTPQPFVEVVAPDQPHRRVWLNTVASWQNASWEAQRGAYASQELLAAVEQVPYSRAWRKGVDAWAPAPVLLWQNGFHIPEAAAQVDDPSPGYRPWFEGVTAQWTGADWQAQRRPYYPQAGVVVEEKVPARASAQLIVAQWGAADWQAQSRHVTPQAAAAAVDAPSPGRRPWLRTAIDSWTPAQILLWQNGVLIEEGGAAPQVDDPPLGHRPWLQTAQASWAPTHLLLWQNGFVAQDGPAVGGDDPPFGKRSWLPTALASWERHLVPLWGTVGIHAEDAVVDQPAPRHNPSIAIARMWAEPTWPAQGWRHVRESGAAPQVDDPAPRRNPSVSIARLWPQPDWMAQGWSKFRESGAAPQVDDPAPRRRAWLPTALASWEQQLVPMWGAFGSAPAVDAQVDAPTPSRRAWLTNVRGQWDITWSAQRGPALVQGAPAQVDQPTPRQNPSISVARLWAAPDWMAQGWHKVVQGAQADAPTPSRRAWLARVSEQWEITWDAQAAPHFDQGTPPQVDNPIPRKNPSIVLAGTWEAPNWHAQGWHVVVQAGAGSEAVGGKHKGKHKGLRFIPNQREELVEPNDDAEVLLITQAFFDKVVK